MNIIQKNVENNSIMDQLVYYTSFILGSQDMSYQGTNSDIGVAICKSNDLQLNATAETMAYSLTTQC